MYLFELTVGLRRPNPNCFGQRQITRELESELYRTRLTKNVFSLRCCCTLRERQQVGGTFLSRWRPTRLLLPVTFSGGPSVFFCSLKSYVQNSSRTVLYGSNTTYCCLFELPLPYSCCRYWTFWTSLLFCYDYSC